MKNVLKSVEPLTFEVLITTAADDNLFCIF